MTDNWGAKARSLCFKKTWYGTLFLLFPLGSTRSGDSSFSCRLDRCGGGGGSVVSVRQKAETPQQPVVKAALSPHRILNINIIHALACIAGSPYIFMSIIRFLRVKSTASFWLAFYFFLLIQWLNLTIGIQRSMSIGPIDWYSIIAHRIHAPWFRHVGR